MGRVVLALVCATALLAGCGLEPSGMVESSGRASSARDQPADEAPAKSSGTSSRPATPDVTGPALAALDTIPVKGRAAKTGYSREAFGQTWADADHNGCDTRNDVLGRDLDEATYKPGTHECVVLTGTLDDPYTGTVIDFRRGQSTSSEVQIDHVVALSNAWQTGAAAFSGSKREQLANDRLELLAVDGSSNESKGDGDAATWLPRNKPYRCRYVARQLAVKLKYGLWVTKPEKAAITRTLKTCPSERIPVQKP